MIRIFFAVFLYALLFACSLQLKDDDQAGAVTVGNTGTIAGLVTIPDSSSVVALKKESKVVSDVQVLLFRQSDSLPFDSTLTDSEGRYAFLKMDTGSYSLEVSLSNGQSYFVDHIRVVAGKTTRCDFPFGAIPPSSSGILYRGPIFQAGQATHQVTSLPGIVGGYWFRFDDRDSGGNSYTEPEASGAFWDMVQSAPGTIQASLHLRPGKAYPWAGIGFHWSDINPVNLSVTDGVCFEYRADHALWISLSLTESNDTNSYGKVFPATSEFQKASMDWTTMDWLYTSEDQTTIPQALLRGEGLNFQVANIKENDSLDVTLEIKSVWFGVDACK